METLRIAVSALNTHKLRSFLTLLGVIIGVMTIVAVVSVISGLNNYVSERVFQLRPDVFVTTKFGIITNREEFLDAVRRKDIDMADYRAVKRSCKSCRMIGASVQTRQAVRYGNRRQGNVDVNGATWNVAELNSLDVEAGRFFTSSEEARSAYVAIIGSDVRDTLFGELDPIGRMISVEGQMFRVIGLFRKQGSVLGQSQDNVLYMPLATFRKSFGGRRSINILVKADSIAAMEPTQDEVRMILRGRRRTAFAAVDPFSMVTAESLQNAWKRISAAAFALMLAISGISLIVGGIVITNIMLVSVVERTREIGIRRAMGARKRDILMQFLTEAVLLSLGGGVAGVLLGAAISRVIAMASPLPTLLTPSIVIVALAVAITTGIAAGFFPARKASQLPPVEALRYE